MKKTILFIVAAVLTVSCSRGVRSELNRLDQELDENPQQVLAKLDSIDFKTLNGHNAAMYAFLQTCASYLAGNDNLSDSVACIAADFWGSNGKGYHKAMGWLAMGLAYSSQNRDPEAIYALLKSKTLSTDTVTVRYAMTNVLLGRHYNRRGLHDEALGVYSDGERLYRRLGDTEALALCRFDMAVAYYERHDYSISEEIFESLLNDSSLPAAKRNSCKLYLAHILNAKDGVRAGEGMLKLADSYLAGCSDEEGAASGYTVKGIALYYLHNPDSAFTYLERAHSLTKDPDTRILAVKGLEQVAVQMRLFQAAWNAEILNREYQNELDRKSSQSEITQIRLEHNDEIQRQKYKAGISKVIMAGIILLVLAVSLVVIINIRRERNLKAYYLEKHDEFIKKQIQEKNESASGKLSQSCESFRAGTAFNMINDIAMQHRAFRLEERDVVVHDINLYFADEIAALKNESGKLGQQEVTYIFCTVLGINQDVIADIMCTSRSNMRSIKSRLKSKISSDSFALYFKE